MADQGNLSDADATLLPRTPMASAARPKKRHSRIAISFLLMVIVPTFAIGFYLYAIAADQYASRGGFSVRSEDVATTSEILGGLSALSSGTSTDTDVLFEFMTSQTIVERIDAVLDLRSMFSKPTFDPVFALNPSASIEDLMDYWARMVRIDYDSGKGLIEIRVNAFTADDARNVAQAIFDANTDTINTLSAVARDDTTRYAREELASSLDALKLARQAMAKFRTENQIVDPSADIAGQMGLVTSLQSQLSEALIEMDLLMITSREGDPRIADASRRIDVIRRRIEEERKKFGLTSNLDGEEDYSSILATYEAIAIDLEYAEESYLLARASYQDALAKSRRQSRYLAAYLQPTLAETPQYPKRLLLLSLSAMFLFFIWSILVLIFYSLKDRR